jgi:hypothetical protein
MRSRLQLGLIVFAAYSSERSANDMFDQIQFEREIVFAEQHALIAVRDT